MFFPVCGVLPVPIVVLFLSKNTVYYRKRRQQYNVYIRFCELENFHIYALRIWSPFLLKMKGNSYDDYNTPDTILTQAELAFRANMNVTYVGDVERANENISISKLILLADALEVPLSELLNSLDEQDISSKSSLVANIQRDLYKLDEKSLISLSEWIDYMLYKQRSR